MLGADDGRREAAAWLLLQVAHGPHVLIGCLVQASGASAESDILRAEGVAQLVGSLQHAVATLRSDNTASAVATAATGTHVAGSGDAGEADYDGFRRGVRLEMEAATASSLALSFNIGGRQWTATVAGLQALWRAEKLERAGFTGVRDFEAGVEGWAEAGYRLEGEGESRPN